MSEFAFPFVGAGVGSVGDVAEVAVRFAAPPPAKARAAIAKDVPEPLARSVRWSKELLVATSAKHVHCDITAGYGKKRPARSASHRAAPRELEAFDSATRAWLEAGHAIAPILVAFQRREIEPREAADSPWHRWSTRQAAAYMPAFAGELAGSRDTAGKRTAIGLLLAILDAKDGYALSAIERTAVEPVLSRASRARRQRFLYYVHVSEPDKYREASKHADQFLLDAGDRVAAIDAIADRIDCFGEVLEGDAQELVLALARKAFPLDPSTLREEDRRVIGRRVLFTVFQSAVQAGDDELAAQMADQIRKVKPAPNIGFVYNDLVRARDDGRLRALADEVFQPTAAKLYDAACGARDPVRALAMYERVLGMPDPPWQAVNNGIAMFLVVHPGELPPAEAATWLARGKAIAEAPCKHNVACLLARLGRRNEALAYAVEAIAGGAALEPIAADRELVSILDDPAIVRALDRRLSGDPERHFYEACRLMVLGRADKAIDALVAAAGAGMDAAELRRAPVLAPLHDHPGFRRVKNPPASKSKRR